MHTFTNNMPTSQLHAVTIVLLCVHFFVMKLQQELPNVIIRMLQWAEERGQSTDSTWPWLTSEIEALNKLFLKSFLMGWGNRNRKEGQRQGSPGHQPDTETCVQYRYSIPPNQSYTYRTVPP
jgi:hypothetical protein